MTNIGAELYRHTINTEDTTDLYKVRKFGCEQGYPISHIAAPPIPTHSGMRVLLEREIPPEGLSSSASPASVGGLIGTDVGSYVGSVVGCTVGLPVGTGVLGDEVGCNEERVRYI